MNTIQWAAVQLHDNTEGVNPEDIERSVKHLVKGCTVFIPASPVKIGQTKQYRWLASGYLYVRLDPGVAERLKNLHDSKFCETVPRLNGKLLAVSQRDIDKLRQQLEEATAVQGIEPGDEVTILTGAWCKLPGTVVCQIPELGWSVKIVLRSTTTLLTLPADHLQRID